VVEEALEVGVPEAGAWVGAVTGPAVAEMVVTMEAVAGWMEQKIAGQIALQWSGIVPGPSASR